MNESERVGKNKRLEQFTFLFLVQGGKVATYRPLEIAGQGPKLDLIPSGGHDFQRFDDDFWEWWRYQFDFVPEGSEVDFAFVATDPELKDFSIPKDFQMVSGSMWTRQLVKSFLEEEEGIGGFSLIEGDDTVCETVSAGKSFYLTRFNVSKDPKLPEQRSSDLYESMRNDPLPREIVEEIKQR